MLFRKSQPDQGKRAPKQQKKAARPKRSGRRLDSVTVQFRPPEPARRPPPAQQPQGRGAPLSPATQWLLDKMRRLRDLDDCGVLKESFIALYLSDPNHHPGSAERAFYSAVQTCKRRLRS